MHRFRVLILGTFMALVAGLPAQAVTLLRDADMEYSLSQLAAPVLRAASLSPNSVRIVVVKDSTLNAFVVDTRTIFIHSGLILKLDSAEALQAVIAHEAAHISNGHITRRMANARSARTAAGLGMALAAAAAVAGADGQAAVGLAFGAQSSARRLFLSHTRAEESSADISSVRYLSRAGIDPKGAIAVQEMFKGQELLSTSRQDPYMLTHPMSRDRLRALKGQVAGLGAKTYNKKNEGTYWFARAKGKLSAFSRAPGWTLRRANDSVSKDIALMRQAVAYHRQSDMSRALKAINSAIALRPKDPFLLDLKGQILLEGRKAKEATKAYASAAKMAGRNPLILGGYGRALLASGQYKAALKALESARSRDFRDPRILRDLAVAYAKNGQNGMASLVTAERYALNGRLKDAEIHAKRAEGLLPRGSAGWQRAQDVLSAAKLAKGR